jgi:hypothetical protein
MNFFKMDAIFFKISCIIDDEVVCCFVRIIHCGDYYVWLNGCMHVFICVPTPESLVEL